MAKGLYRLLLVIFVLAVQNNISKAQQFPATPGPIPFGQTTCFPINVSGVGTLNPSWAGWGPFLDEVCIDIITDHPQTLVITLESPQGTTITLSAYNGAGGSNYTGTCFTYWSSTSIVGAAAPFTGNYEPQGPGDLSSFDLEWADGIWNLCIQDTLSVLDTTGTGYIASGFASGTIGFGNGGPPPPPPCFGTLSDNLIYLCPGETVDITSYYTSWGWGWTFSYSLNGNPVPNPAAANTPGYYTIYGVDSWGCFDDATFVIIAEPQIQLGPDQSIDICQGNTQNLNALFSLPFGTNSAWSFNGTPILTSAASAANATGNYQLIATNQGGCNDTIVIAVNMVNAPSVGPNISFSGCGLSNIDLTSFYNVTGLTASWTYNGTPVPNPSSVNITGTYMLIATAGSGCSDTALVTYSLTSAPSLGVNQTVTVCAGIPVDLTSLFLTSGLTTSWTLGGNTVANPAAVTASGNYMIIATDAGGCTDTATVLVNSMTGPSLGADQTADFCSGSSFDLTTLYSTTGLNVSWDFNGNTVSNPSSVTTAGNYIIVATDLNGCTDAATVTLNSVVPPSLGPDISGGFCPGTAFDMTIYYVTTGLNVNWDLNGTPVNNPSSITTPGNYNIVVTDIYGCTDAAVVTVNSIPGPALGPDQNTAICSGTTTDLELLFNITGLATSWNLSGTPVNPSNVSAGGNYTLIAIDNSGCADTAVVTVSINAVPLLGPNQAISFCTGSTVDLTTLYATPGLIVSWLTGGNPVSNPNMVTTAGVYDIFVTDVNGCYNSATATLSNIAPPSLGVDQVASFCTGASADLTNLFTTTGLTTSWTLSGNPVANPAAISLPGNYMLIASGAAGCTDTAFVLVNSVTSPSLGGNQAVSFCSGTSIDLTSLYSTTGLVESWTLNSTVVNNPSSITVPGNYNIVVIDVNGCTDGASVNVSSLVSPSLGPDQNQSFCPGYSTDLTTLFITTGNTVNWTLSGAPVSVPSAINTAGIYQIAVYSPNGCSDSALVNVTVSAGPTPGPDQQVTACAGTVIDLTSLFNTTSYSVSWSSNAIPVLNPDAITSAGIYEVLCTNVAGCTSIATATVIFNAVPSVGGDVTLSGCAGIPVDITNSFVTTGLTTSWTLSGSAVPDPVAVTATGIYQLIVTDANNCSDTALADVTINTGPSLGADLAYTLCQWMTVDATTVFGNSGLNYSATFNGQNISNLNALADSGIYLIVATDINGCTDEATIAITLISCECIADFDFNAHCMQDPVSLQVIADSAVISAHWSFSSTTMTDVFGENTSVKFTSAEPVMVTLEVNIGCDTKIIEKIIQVEDCSESCHFYIPSAFTPNNDGKNDAFRSYSECDPLEYEIEIWNRYGQLIYQSDNQRSVWDGKDIPEGMYIYHVNYRMPYQLKKNVTGRVTVLR